MTEEKQQSANRYDALAEFKSLKALAQEFGVDIPLKTGFTPDDINAIMPLLRYKLPDAALQESDGSRTGKGYDTTGYSYQAHIDRMNWVFGPTHWRWSVLNETVEEGETSRQKRKFTYYGDIMVEIGYKEKDDMGEWQWRTVWDVPPYPTDHESVERGSARKGMLTKGLKRATSTIGVGADAWLGVFDDDLITGAEPGERMAEPAGNRRREPGPRDAISERDFDYLLKTGQRKGFTAEHLQTWLRDQTDGSIDKDLANLTNLEFEEAKRLLFTIPQGKTIQDMQGDQSRRERREQEQPNEHKQEPAGEAQGGVQNAEGEPKNLEELLLCTDDRVRELAKRHNFNMPASLNAQNRRPLCKALASVMRIPA